MRLFDDHPERNRYLVFLDGKYVPGVLVADDDEGWVEILDPSSTELFPPCRDESDGVVLGNEGVSEWEEIPAVRKYGKVVFKVLPG